MKDMSSTTISHLRVWQPRAVPACSSLVGIIAHFPLSESDMSNFLPVALEVRQLQQMQISCHRQRDLNLNKIILSRMCCNVDLEAVGCGEDVPLVDQDAAAHPDRVGHVRSSAIHNEGRQAVISVS